jgi:hypothetical protein
MDVDGFMGDRFVEGFARIRTNFPPLPLETFAKN